MTRSLRGFGIGLLLLLVSTPAAAGLLTLSVVSGVSAHDGAAPIEDPLWRETLSGTTLAQLGTPMLVDPESGALLGLTVRITNTSDAAITFPSLFGGVSVLASVSGVPGYASKTVVAAGGAASASGGAEGAVVRDVLDMTAPLEALSSPASGTHGGGGGAAVGVADCWVSVTGASGAVLAAYLSELTLEPGAFVDIPDFIRIAAFGRSVDDARIAIGFDLFTFSSGGRSVTTGSWTGAFTGPGSVEPPPQPVAVPEPSAWSAVLLGLIAGGGLRRPRRDGVENRAGERG